MDNARQDRGRSVVLFLVTGGLYPRLAQISPEILTRCLAPLSPHTGPLFTKEHLAREIGWIVSFLSDLHRRSSRLESKVIRDQYLETAATFEQTVRLLKRWDPGSAFASSKRMVRILADWSMVRSPEERDEVTSELERFVPDTVEHIQKVAEVSKFLSDAACAARKRAKEVPLKRPIDNCKFSAALFALLLLKLFGYKAPTLTSDGPFFRLAADLYEAATGLRDVSLERQCRRAFDSELASQIPHRADAFA